MKLAEDSLVHSRPKQWAMRVLIAVGLIALVTALTLAVRHLVNQPDAPKRQTAKITLLPDTPPPPPPPPKEEPKQAPKDDVKQVMQDQPKQADTPPPDAPIKMEGAAGDGPSAFAAGAVTQEYKSGAPVVGNPASAAGAAMDRATARLYANTVRQLLRDEIEKNLRPDAGELVASFAVWVEGDGRIRRHEVVPSGDTRTDADMASALDGAARALRLPPPAGVQQPMRFKLNVRPQG